MIKISHRGNVDGPETDLENHPDYIDTAISLGYDVEIDLRVHKGDLFLGHDHPDHAIDLQWLHSRSENIWIHAKDFNALDVLCETNLRYFYHDIESYTLLSNGLIWCHDITNCNNKSVIPLIDKFDIIKYTEYNFVYGICSDYVKYIVP